MERELFAVLVLAWMAVAPLPTVASDRDSIGAIVENCRDIEPNPNVPPASAEVAAVTNYLSCIQYLRGVVSSHDGTTGASRKRPSLCLPAGETVLERVREIFLVWVDDHPDALRGPAPVAIVQALEAAYACPPE